MLQSKQISKPALSWVNGCPEERLSIVNRGFQYGDGLFETILLLKGKLVLGEQHLNRLFRDVARLSISVDENLLRSELKEFISGVTSESGVVKIIITRKSSGRGYSYEPGASSDRFMQFYSGVGYPSSYLDGIRVCLSDQKLSQNSVLAGIKHLNRLDQVLASSSLSSGFYQECLLEDVAGNVIEGLFSNLFIISDGKLLTPALHLSGVRGVMRDYILGDAAPDLNLDAVAGNLTLDDILRADEVFMCNSVYGLRPVRWINVREFPVGEHTRALQKRVHALGYSDIYH